MVAHNDKEHRTLAADIKRQLGDRSTRRFLHAMPAFKPVTDIPDHLRRLLDRLEEQELVARSENR